MSENEKPWWLVAADNEGISAEKVELYCKRGHVSERQHLGEDENGHECCPVCYGRWLSYVEPTAIVLHADRSVAHASQFASYCAIQAEIVWIRRADKSNRYTMIEGQRELLQQADESDRYTRHRMALLMVDLEVGDDCR